MPLIRQIMENHKCLNKRATHNFIQTFEIIMKSKEQISIARSIDYNIFLCCPVCYNLAETECNHKQGYFLSVFLTVSMQRENEMIR